MSCLERCPYFRGVLIEGFHCNNVSVHVAAVQGLYNVYEWPPTHPLQGTTMC